MTSGDITLGFIGDSDISRWPLSLLPSLPTGATSGDDGGRPQSSSFPDPIVEARSGAMLS
eukprot:CAMPEP_0197451190 /NCGR_PEP_ID=MMETSP1175-20131217/28004_1 /TAXON_ID=1003142 /ORGANISM="Triceratium dubium, Strain CCMP147" /LENGTH=59 /DNA_ID=CAMNT_0042983829 /DNA_START=6 /DNA_END=182 /DNA_ORIENTATION=+